MTEASRNLDIICYPDPRLRRVCRELEGVTDEVRLVAERMIELMRANNGVGLAAPQVGLDWRLFVAQPTDGEPPQAFVNPRLTLGEEMASRDEGCLSLPDVTVSVRRAVQCRIEALGLDGAPIALDVRDLPARVYQHECDHLDGRLIIDVMSQAERISNRKVLKRLEKEFNSSSRRGR